MASRPTRAVEGRRNIALVPPGQPGSDLERHDPSGWWYEGPRCATALGRRLTRPVCVTPSVPNIHEMLNPQFPPALRDQPEAASDCATSCAPCRRSKDVRALGAHRAGGMELEAQFFTHKMPMCQHISYVRSHYINVLHPCMLHIYMMPNIWGM